MRHLRFLFLILLTAIAAADSAVIAAVQPQASAVPAVESSTCPADELQNLSPLKAAQCEHEAAFAAEARDEDARAEVHYHAAIALWDKAGAKGSIASVATLINLGSLYLRQSRPSEAMRIFEQASQRLSDGAAAMPELEAILRSRSAAASGELGQTERARQLFEESIAVLRTPVAKSDAALAWALNSFGLLDLDVGRYQDAEVKLREAVSLGEESLGEEDSTTAAYMTNLALALLLRGNPEGADTLLQRARFVIEKHSGPDTPRLVNTLAELSTAQTRLGKFRLAEVCDEQELRILMRRAPERRQDIVLTQVHLAALFLSEHRTVEAGKILPDAVAAERLYYRNGRTLADGLRSLAVLRVQQRAWSESEPLYREAIGMYEESLGQAHPELAKVLREYADVLKREKAPKSEIRQAEERARNIESHTRKPRAS
jgi:tetratricopeptide (TPR) repeat protein